VGRCRAPEGRGRVCAPCMYRYGRWTRAAFHTASKPRLRALASLCFSLMPFLVSCPRVSVLLPHAIPRPLPTPLHAERRANIIGTIRDAPRAPSTLARAFRRRNRRMRHRTHPDPMCVRIGLTRSCCASAGGPRSRPTRTSAALVPRPPRWRRAAAAPKPRSRRAAASGAPGMAPHSETTDSIDHAAIMSRYVSHRHRPVSVATSSGGGARESRGPRR
jgi:hypothetical protein